MPFTLRRCRTFAPPFKPPPPSSWCGRCDFTPNPQTSADNAFQSRQQSAAQALDAHTAAQRARDEVTAAAATLEAHGVRVHLFDDDGALDTPDSVFPNNWFSTHAGGHVALYPMYSPNRRRERRADVIEMLKREYRVQDVIDYSGLEPDGLFLEGTGAMVLDHLARVAYAARSNRADAVALERFCTHFNFEPMAFDTADAAGRAVYHTNVLMCVGTEFALVGLDLFTDPQRRAAGARAAAKKPAARCIEPRAPQQIDEFAGNALELRGPRRARAGDVGARRSEPAPRAAPVHRAVSAHRRAAGADDRAGRRLGALHAGGDSFGSALTHRSPAHRRASAAGREGGHQACQITFLRAPTHCS